MLSNPLNFEVQENFENLMVFIQEIIHLRKGWDICNKF